MSKYYMSQRFFRSFQSNAQIYCSLLFYSTKVHRPSNSASKHVVDVEYSHGAPIFTVPLPSRRERCKFPLKPLTHTIRDFETFLFREDKGIDRVAIYDEDGERFSKSSPIDSLMKQSFFKIVINDVSYDVRPAKPTEDLPVNLIGERNGVDHVKSLIGVLYSQLHIDEHQRMRELNIQKDLEKLKQCIAPYEQARAHLFVEATKRTNRLKYIGLACMGFQMGLFGRLTWSEYSWDIMEPVTYFATFSTLVAFYCYFLAVNQCYEYHDVFDRQFLLGFHKNAEKVRFNIDKYNELKYKIYQAEYDLKRLRDPLQLNLPIDHLRPKDDSTLSYNFNDEGEDTVASSKKEENRGNFLSKKSSSYFGSFGSLIKS